MSFAVGTVLFDYWHLAYRETRWMDEAFCRGWSRDGEDYDNPWFAPPGEHSQGKERKERIALAKGLCAECPVRQRCLNDALEMEGQLSAGNRFGIWGGLDEIERFELATGRKRPKRIRRKEAA